MRLFIATLIFGAAATVAQDPYKHPTTNDITRRTADLLQGILDDIYKGGLEHLEAKKSAYLCDLASKKGSVLGFVGGLEIESYWKNKLEEYLEKKCKVCCVMHDISNMRFSRLTVFARASALDHREERL